MKTRDKAPGRSPGWEELAFVQRAETAERDCLRASPGQPDSPSIL